MSKDITTSGPSRRSIAKGAAWAVPAVSVAAAAPSLAASTDCPAGTLVVTVENCQLLNLLSAPPQFRITNPSSSGCTVPAGTAISLSSDALLSVDVSDLNDLNVGVAVFSSSTEATTSVALAAGDSRVVKVFNPGLADVDAAGVYKLTVGGSTAEFTLIAQADILIPILSSCVSPND